MRSTYRFILVGVFLLSGFFGVEQTVVASTAEAEPMLTSEAVNIAETSHDV